MDSCFSSLHKVLSSFPHPESEMTLDVCLTSSKWCSKTLTLGYRTFATCNRSLWTLREPWLSQWPRKRVYCLILPAGKATCRCFGWQSQLSPAFCHFPLLPNTRAKVYWTLESASWIPVNGLYECLPISTPDPEIYEIQTMAIVLSHLLSLGVIFVLFWFLFVFMQ